MTKQTPQVQVLSTPGCAGCAQLKHMITTVLGEFPGLSWEEVDVTEHPELAAEYGIMSVPAVVIGGELAFTRVPKEDTLRDKLNAYTKEATKT